MNGVGRQLVWSAIDKARKHFPVLNTRSPETAFGFYETLGFERLDGDDGATHRMKLARPTASPRARSGSRDVA
jgi:hypothetical protein